MDRENESIYLLDMTACEPRDAFSEDFEKGKWTAVDFLIEQGEGKMLFCGPDTQAPPLSLDPDVKGWYHIFVGTYRPSLDPETVLLLKLSSDQGYSKSTPETFRIEKDLVDEEMLPGPTDLCEAFWKSADLTGEDIIFHRPAAGEWADRATNISYIRLVPLSRAEQERVERDLKRTDTRLLIANYDSNQNTYWSYGTHQEMVDEFQAVANSDFRIMLWGCAGSLATFYPSRVGSEMKWAFGLPGRIRKGWQTLDRYRLHGFDPLREAVQCAHDIDIEIYAQVRMIGEQLPPNHRGFFGPGDFQTQHPEWRCLTREGYRTHHLSQAFPEVRTKYVELFREWVEDYEADGVCIIFCRSYPYALYEEPVTRSFREKHGLDMKDLDPFDEHVLNHRAEFLTQLLRETREMLDEVGEKRGKRLGTCYVVPADGSFRGSPDLGPFTPSCSVGMDVETWVKEGLVDHLVPHIEGAGKADASDRAPIIRSYVDLAKGTETRVYPDLYPRRQSAESSRIRALACYDAGVDGLCFWDTMIRTPRLSGWAMHRLLGHKDELPSMKGFAESLFRVVPMTSLDGYMVENPYCLPTDG